MTRVNEIWFPFWQRIRNVQFSGLFRPHGERADRVTFIELFFDLVYVFAITRLSYLFLGHLDGEGLFQTTLLLLAVWWAWIDTTWLTNWLDPDKRPVRIALLGLMFVSLLMSAVIPDAFGDRGFMFALAYVVLQNGRNLFAVAASRERPALFRNFQRILAWSLVSGVFWILGGLFDDTAREVLWLIAVIIDFAGPMTGFRTPRLGKSTTAEWDISGHLLAERCQLFLIIALGESLLVIGSTYQVMDSSFKLMLTFIVAFVGTVGLWWLYFSRSAADSAAIIAASPDPGRLARSAYTYFHIPMVAGIILVAVGDELVMVHPNGDTNFWTAFALLGGPIIYLAGQAWFKWLVYEAFALSRAGGIVALVVLYPISTFTPPWFVALCATLVIVGIAIWDVKLNGKYDANHRLAITPASGLGHQPEDTSDDVPLEYQEEPEVTPAPEPPVSDVPAEQPDETPVEMPAPQPETPDVTPVESPTAPLDKPADDDDEIPRPPGF